MKPGAGRAPLLPSCVTLALGFGARSGSALRASRLARRHVDIVSQMMRLGHRGCGCREQERRGQSYLRGFHLSSPSSDPRSTIAARRRSRARRNTFHVFLMFRGIAAGNGHAKFHIGAARITEICCVFSTLCALSRATGRRKFQTAKFRRDRRGLRVTVLVRCEIVGKSSVVGGLTPA
jgi:hypothetical protein